VVVVGLLADVTLCRAELRDSGFVLHLFLWQ
jgi:hypothetical protein